MAGVTTPRAARTLHGAATQFTPGMVEIGPSLHAWLQPNGDWGESNAGLIVGEGAAALVDTAWDLPLTRRLLADAARATPEPIGHLLLTHADGDHVNGAQLLPQATVVAATETAREMLHEDPAGLHRSRLGAGLLARVGIGQPRRFGRYVEWMLGCFDFRGIEIRTPDRTFSGALDLEIGGRPVHLRTLGPAHTQGDTIVHVPDAQTIFAGDLLFTGVTPNGWACDIDHWRRALDAIGQLGATTIVPGHGPISGMAEIEELDRYWGWMQAQAGALLAAGASVDAAALALVTSDAFAAEPWSRWACPERTVCNVIAVDRARRSARLAITHRERPLVLWKVARLAHALDAHRTSA